MQKNDAVVHASLFRGCEMSHERVRVQVDRKVGESERYKSADEKLIGPSHDDAYACQGGDARYGKGSRAPKRSWISPATTCDTPPAASMMVTMLPASSVFFPNMMVAYEGSIVVTPR